MLARNMRPHLSAVYF